MTSLYACNTPPVPDRHGFLSWRGLGLSVAAVFVALLLPQMAWADYDVCDGDATCEKYQTQITDSTDVGELNSILSTMKGDDNLDYFLYLSLQNAARIEIYCINNPRKVYCGGDGGDRKTDPGPDKETTTTTTPTEKKVVVIDGTEVETDSDGTDTHHDDDGYDRWVYVPTDDDDDGTTTDKEGDGSTTTDKQVYARTSRATNNEGEHLTFGIWSDTDANTDNLDPDQVAFTDGPAATVDALVSLTGTATYSGAAIGNTSYSPGGAPNFDGSVTLRANFGSATVAGKISGEINGWADFADTTGSAIALDLRDAALRSGSSSFSSGVNFHLGRGNTSGTGSWNGVFNGNTDDGSPWGVTGTFRASSPGEVIPGHAGFQIAGSFGATQTARAGGTTVTPSARTDSLSNNSYGSEK